MSQKSREIRGVNLELQTVFDSLDSYLILLDETGLILKSNHSFLSFLQKPREEIERKRFSEIDFLSRIDEEHRQQFAQSLQSILVGRGHEVAVENDPLLAAKRLKNETFEILLTDLKMPQMDGLTLLEIAKAENPEIECIAITAYASIDSAVKAIKLGAFSYFVKSSDPQELLLDLEKLEQLHFLKSQNAALKANLQETDSYLGSKNREFLQMMAHAKKVAQTDSNVLILGESGSGKEVIARHIHKLSARESEVFMAVNCYSFSDTMLEAELYGHEKGAFTGSTASRAGQFEAANKGTLFLDEIGDIPLTTQSKILRNIERKEIERIGSNRTISLNFRLITATNRDIRQAISSGEFRDDLYYRISTVVLRVPPLRDRPEDIPSLIDFLMQKTARDMKRIPPRLDDEALGLLKRYRYPGNIRELKSIIERILILSDGPLIKARDLKVIGFLDFGHETKPSVSFPGDETLRELRNRVEKEYILEILESTERNLSLAAKRLDLSLRQLYNKLNDYDISIK